MNSNQRIISQQREIKVYFDRIAPSYPARLQHPFLHYFFTERLEASLNAFASLPNAILDIGAGTGIVFDEIQKRGWTGKYFALDVSEPMLRESNIPPAQYHVGDLFSAGLEKEYFDAIFMLGVSTYLSEADMDRHFHWIRDHLTKEGLCCISFTHRASLDFRLRKLFRRILPVKKTSEKVIAQDFSISAYRPDDIPLSDLKLEVVSLTWLNQTLPPFNRWFPKLSIWKAALLKRILPPRLLPFFSSDFLLILRNNS